MGLHITRYNYWCLSIVCFLMLIGSPHFEDHVFAQDNAGALAQAAEEEARVAQALADAKVQAAKDAQKALEDAATKVIAAEEEARMAQETAAAKALRAKKSREALSKAQPGLANASAKAAAMEKARLTQEKAAAAEDARLAEEKAVAQAKAAEDARQAEEKAAAQAKAAEDAQQAEEKAAAQAKAAEDARLAEEKAAAQAKAAEDARLAEEKAAAQAKAAEDARLAEEKAAAQAKATEDARLAEEKAAAQAKAAEDARLAEEKAAAQAKATEDARLAEEKAAAQAKATEDARQAEEKAAAQAKAAEEAQLAEKKAAAKAATKAPVASAKTKTKTKKTSGATATPIRDWTNIVGSKECGECHKAEVFTWKDTHHATTFNLLPRKKNTKKITKKMGIRSVKRDSDCLTCHFTAKIIEGKEKVISGISCESCHGPAAKWVKIHGDYGGKKVKKDMETPEHKAERLAKIEEAKMIRPQNLYRVAQNCYQCHTVPNEKLVNVGGHKPGSNFELVSWSQGEVRHNFFNSDNKENRKASSERKRLMYIVGRALHLEYTLRGVAKSTEKAKYAVTMAKRAVKIKKDLTAIQKLINIPEIKNMLNIANGVKLKLNNELALVKAADKIAVEAKKLAKGYTGKEWKAVDALLPTKVKGKAGEGPPPGQ